jgi:hypothetical protein
MRYAKEHKVLKFQSSGTSYSPIGRYQCFGRVCYVYLQGRLEMQAAYSFKMLVIIYQTSRYHILDGRITVIFIIMRTSNLSKECI